MCRTQRNVSASWVEVLVDCPGATGLYTYRIPESLEVSPGDIVSVSFGRQQVGAIAIRIIQKPSEDLHPSSIKPIESILNSAFFNKEYWQLLNRVARYYQTPFIRVIRTALPPGLLSKSQRRIRLSSQATADALTQLSNRSFEQTSSNQTPSNQPLLSPLALQLIETLQNSPNGDYSWQYLRQQLKRHPSAGPSASTQALQQLIQQALIESYLAPPQVLHPQKRQAVLLIQTAQASQVSDNLSDRQRAILSGLAHHGGELWLSDALQLLRTTSKTLKKIEAQGYLIVEPRERLRSGSHSTALPDQPKVLTGDQAKALAVIQQLQGYREVLLHGVTGSGKTEVYLQAIAPHLQAQRSALVLVPEIGLTPQLTDRFRSRFGDRVCVYHSGLSEGERYDTWRQMFTGTPQVIIGTRSAIFAPLPNLGILILDEEHDSSFKQDQPMPCYHARQVAQWRAELENCPLILGSATPSIETWVRFRASEAFLPDSKECIPLPNLPSPSDSNRKEPLYLSLPERVYARPLPPIEIVDMRKELHEGNRTIFSRSLQQALEDLIEKGNQGILFIHRRGHSSFVSCRSCGYVMDCPHCDVSLSFHQTRREGTAWLQCHYCGYRQNQPSECPECASPYLKNFGSGTQRVVNDLAKYLPQARCIRFDSDTTRNKGAHRSLLTRFAQGEADLLVGTQMLTKGIDLPQVTLVGVIAADGLLFMPDYRASERAFQTLTQVAGRAGRGEQPGRVIVQTYSPEHVAIEALVPSQAGYADFLKGELGDRAALHYPPYGQLVLLRVSGFDEKVTERAAQTAADQLAYQLQPKSEEPDRYSIMGPVPAPIFRVARRYRWHVLLKLSIPAPLPDLTSLQRQVPKGVSLTIDVDPLNLS
ncbi:MAG: primosomal protein N' [Phormidesmis sp.]